MKGVSLLIGFVTFALMLAMGVARAQEDTFGSSYLTPFPPGELYSIAVIGDDMADGLIEGLNDAFLGDRRLSLRPKRNVLNGLNRPDFNERLVSLEDDLKHDTPQIAIIMLGAWDRISLRDGAGKKLAIGSPEWRTEYGARGDRLMKMLKRLKVSVYWVGLPNVRRADSNDDNQMINEVVRERIILNGLKHVDVYANFLDEQGGYDAFGPDLTGKIVRLRDGDGDFTGAGFRKLAHFVDRDLRRDLTQARADRDVPLAGAETEQAKVNPDKAKLAEPAPGALTKGAALAAPVGGSSGSTAALQPAQTDAAPGEQKAETGKITLKTLSASGKEETLNLDIVRPAIAASVVQLVTRRESADKPAQMGDNLIDQISGGLIVMNSVTPPTNQNSRDGAPKLSAAQSPYFRVLFKGERLQPKPGRADDASWPRMGSAQSLEKVSKAVAPAAPAVAAPAETGSTLKAPPSSTEKPLPDKHKS